MINDLLLQQDELQKEAGRIIAELNLEQILGECGKVCWVGSYPLGLMAWKDIDVEVRTANASREIVAVVVSKLATKFNKRIGFTLLDNREGTIDLPHGLYIGVKYFGNLENVKVAADVEDKVWKIDIWFLDEAQIAGREKTKEIKDKLAPDLREIILQIKQSVWDNQKYRRSFSSVDIYDAVLDNRVKTLEEFEAYLSRSNRSL